MQTHAHKYMHICGTNRVTIALVRVLSPTYIPKAPRTYIQTCKHTAAHPRPKVRDPMPRANALGNNWIANGICRQWINIHTYKLVQQFNILWLTPVMGRSRKSWKEILASLLSVNQMWAMINACHAQQPTRRSSEHIVHTDQQTRAVLRPPHCHVHVQPTYYP